MHLQLIIVTRSPNLYASSATPTPWCNSTRRKRIQGELSWSATKILRALSKRPEIFAWFFAKFRNFYTEFHRNPALEHLQNIRYSMHLQLIIVTRSPNLYSSSATPTPWCNSTRRKRIQGELSWSATKILRALSKRPEIFARFLLNFEISTQSFIEIQPWSICKIWDIQCTYSLSLWLVRLIFVPPLLLQHPGATPLEESAFEANYPGRPQKYFGHYLNVPKYLPDFC